MKRHESQHSPESQAQRPTAARGRFGRWLGRLAGRRRSSEGRAAERRQALSEAIALFPQAPLNYVLRGELYLEQGSYALAAEDFRRALILAQAQLEEQRFGIIAQIVRDRAQLGLSMIGYSPYAAEEEVK